MTAAPTVTRTILFTGASLTIGETDTRPASAACGDVEYQPTHAVVLPLTGLFAKHDAPGRHVIATPSHAVLIARDAPYRLSFPGAIGDRALVLRFGDALAPDRLPRPDAARHGLLPASAMMLRNLLWTRLARHAADDFEREALGLDLLAASLEAMGAGDAPPPPRAAPRRARAVERVKEAVALAPAEKWTIERLAGIAHLSPFHLCHVFRATVGTSLHDYVLHERLAQALDAVLDSGDDLTAIALDAGFASHSHFTARFRSFFGCTPTALRRRASTARLAQLRTIVTAAAAPVA